jgi:hypothetical protein
MHNANSSIYGIAASTIKPTTPANIIRPNTTKPYNHFTSKTRYHANKFFQFFLSLLYFDFTFVDPMIQL